MLGRGVPTGHIITVLGSFGTGKTTFALQFLMQGLINGEKAIFISLEEDADSVIANAASFGWDLPTYIKEKKLHIVKLEPADAKTTVTRIRSELPDFIKRSGASRVAIDSISLLNMLFADDKERREKLFALCKQLRSTEATCIFTAEVKDDNPRSSRDGLVEYVSDGVIRLRFNERDNGDGQLDWENGFRARAERLRGLPQAQVLRAARQLRPVPGAKEFVDWLRAQASKVVLVTGGPREVAESALELFEADAAFSNEFQYEDGRFTGSVTVHVSPQSKGEIVRELATKWRIEKDEIVAVGDGVMDVPLLSEAGLRLPINSEGNLKNHLDFENSDVRHAQRWPCRQRAA